MTPAEALGRVERATIRRCEGRDELDAIWRGTILEAIAAGCTRTEIAEHAGITRGRVTQIEQGRR